MITVSCVCTCSIFDFWDPEWLRINDKSYCLPVLSPLISNTRTRHPGVDRGHERPRVCVCTCIFRSIPPTPTSAIKRCAQWTKGSKVWWFSFDCRWMQSDGTNGPVQVWLWIFCPLFQLSRLSLPSQCVRVFKSTHISAEWECVVWQAVALKRAESFPFLRLILNHQLTLKRPPHSFYSVSVTVHESCVYVRRGTHESAHLCVPLYIIHLHTRLHIQNTIKKLWNITTVQKNCFLSEYIENVILFLWWQSWIYSRTTAIH